MDFRAPLGMDDFAALRRAGLAYVDKSQLIADLVEDGALVTLFPRPRRFGKTTNLSMVRHFFERSPDSENVSGLFQDLAVWRSEAARAHFQRHPVISFTMKEIKPATWDLCLASLGSLIARLYKAHVWLLKDPSFRPYDRETFQAILEERASPTALVLSLLELSRLLHEATGEACVILIDEYDTPVHAAWLHGYYEPAIEFFRVFLGAGLKGNSHLYKGVLTGILRIAKESIFSDMNHLAVYSLLRTRYGTAFGFTEDEVRRLAADAGATAHLGTLKRWYNGYRCGDIVLYNPWSVLSFLGSEDFFPRAYWVNTSSNDLIRHLVTTGRTELSEDLETLLHEGHIQKRIDEGLVLPDLAYRDEAIWSLLLFSGYLKPTAKPRPGKPVRLAIPNREVAELYDAIFQRWMDQRLGGEDSVHKLLTAMLEGRTDELAERMQTLVLSALSFHDVGGTDPEKVYHAFVLGLLVYLRRTHRVTSNRESGFGRADVMVTPKKAGQPGVVLELKRLREDETPEHALDAAEAQIVEKRYADTLVEAGARPVYRYAVVFDGKRIRIRGG